MNVQLKINLLVLKNYLEELKGLITHLKLLETQYDKLKEELIQDLEIDLGNLERLIELLEKDENGKKKRSDKKWLG